MVRDIREIDAEMTELQKRWQSLQAEREDLVSSSLGPNEAPALEHHDPMSSDVASKEQVGGINVSDLEALSPQEQYLLNGSERLAIYKKISSTMEAIAVNGLVVELLLIVLILPMVFKEPWVNSWEMLQTGLIYNGLIMALFIAGGRNLKTVKKVEQRLKMQSETTQSWKAKLKASLGHRVLKRQKDHEHSELSESSLTEAKKS